MSKTKVIYIARMTRIFQVGKRKAQLVKGEIADTEVVMLFAENNRSNYFDKKEVADEAEAKAKAKK